MCLNILITTINIGGQKEIVVDTKTSNFSELLDLLIERFHIPDPEMSEKQDDADLDISDKTCKMRFALDIKRFRKEYSQPVQFRV